MSDQRDYGDENAPKPKKILDVCSVCPTVISRHSKTAFCITTMAGIHKWYCTWQCGRLDYLLQSIIRAEQDIMEKDAKRYNGG